MTTLKDTLKKKNFSSYTEIQNFLRGKKVKIVKNTGGHNYGKIGDVLVIDRPYVASTATPRFSFYKEDGKKGNNIRFDEVALIPKTKTEIIGDIKQLEEKISGLNEEIEELERQLSFMNEMGMEEYDENVYKVYTILQELKSKDDDMSKAKAIAELL